MSKPPNDAFKEAVWHAMPPPPRWVTVPQLYEMMDVGAIETVRLALLSLAADGRVGRFGPIMQPAFQRIDGRPSADLEVRMAAYRKELAAWKER